MAKNAYDQNMSRSYDAIVEAGYYDYSGAADAIVQAIGSRKKVLELGIGTGLLAKKLIERGLEISGLDFSKSMLEIAVERLGESVRLYEQDVTELDLPETYEVAVSHGGVWVGIREGNYVDSHITDPKRNLEGLRRVARHLHPDGLLVLGIQHEHKNRAGIDLECGAKYSSRVDFQGDLICKQHLVQKDSKVIAEQNVVIRRFGEEAYTRMMNTAGFTTLGKDASKRLLVFQKRE